MSEFNIDPEAINQYVSEKIIESSIGELLKKEIDGQIKRISSSYDNPMKAVVANAIANAAREYLETPEIKTRLKEIVKNALTDEALDLFIAQIVKEGYHR